MNRKLIWFTILAGLLLLTSCQRPKSPGTAKLAGDSSQEQTVAGKQPTGEKNEAQAPDGEGPKESVDALLQQVDLSDSGASLPQDIYVPSEGEVTPAWLETRAEQQRATTDQFEVFYDFQFQNRQPESGIDWESTIVEDAGKTYVAAHYDHGNGIAIADIDDDGLYDLYLTSQIGANALYRNLGDGKYQNIAEAAGVGLAKRISVAASFADIDNDGDPDLFVTTVRGGNALFRNEGQGKFTDISEAAGVNYVGHSSGSVFFDYDRDGFLDLFVTNVGKYTTEEIGTGGYYRSRQGAFGGHLQPELTETSILYRNVDGTHFQDVTEQTKLIDDSWSGDASPVDVNGDGWPDLYTLDMQGHDEYFENIEGKTFEKRSREVFPKTPWGAMGIKVFDFNNDGHLDIYVTDMHSDMSEQIGIEKEKFKANMQWDEAMLRSDGQSIFGNAFFLKQPDGTYKEVSDLIRAENYWPWGLSVGDLNADGFDDVFVASSMNLPLRYGVNTVLLNNRGKTFLDSEFILGVEPRRDGVCAKAWFTLDCDGPDRENRYAQQAGISSGKVTVWSALGSRSSVIFDQDGDGDLDIVANEFNSPPLILESNLAAQTEVHFLKVKLVGTQSNRDGLGAVVQVRSGDNTFKKVHDGKSGYLSQSSQLLYFGLGDSSSVDEVRVRWPSGIEQSVQVSTANQIITVTEPASP